MAARTDRPRTARRPTPAQRWYPGRSLGLPEAGRGSLAGWSRRIVSVLIDWLLANLAAYAIARSPHMWQAPFTGVDALPLLVFAVEIVVLTALAGGSAGQLVRRLVLMRPDGRRASFWRILVRTLLVLLVIPALLTDPDGRPLHDRVVDTVLVKRR